MPSKTPRQTPDNALEPRIAPLGEAEMGPDALELAATIRRNFKLAETASIPAVVATMLRHPDLYTARVDYTGKRLRASALAERDLELAILRTAWVCQAAYSWGEHVAMGKRAGMSAEEIERLTQGSDAPGWSEHDRAIVRAVDELHDDAMIGDETWASLAKTLDEKQLIEMIIIIGTYHENAYLYNSLRSHLIKGNPGLAAR